VKLTRVRLTLSLAEAMAVIAILGIGLALPSEISIPVGILGGLWLIVGYLPPRRAKAGMIVLGVLALVLLVGLLWKSRLTVRLGPMPKPTIVPVMGAKTEL
jgi:hypothetical protein